MWFLAPAPGPQEPVQPRGLWGWDVRKTRLSRTLGGFGPRAGTRQPFLADARSIQAVLLPSRTGRQHITYSTRLITLAFRPEINDLLRVFQVKSGNEDFNPISY
ncbi:hypothetical protein Y1Q_0010876 [Alligator mississippiensis]|uniref:Uncharacterized protein n=1 Tax=Alligator mississippiensis TaxID=8496 RepID=A0A151M774_ALLMI|nr:hypothetical protein Y1Q_0010876 [Alligator mississippiensis]